MVGTALASASAATGGSGQAGHHHRSGIQHVLLVSVDGLHQQDLVWYVRNNPGSLLASLFHHGLEYSRAETPFPYPVPARRRARTRRPPRPRAARLR